MRVFAAADAATVIHARLGGDRSVTGLDPHIDHGEAIRFRRGDRFFEGGAELVDRGYRA